MEITLIGHASVLIEAGGVGLLTDPWYVGEAFNESWSLHPEPSVPDDLAERVTHVWISHEHPDHLSPATLLTIPAPRRATMTLLYQAHWSNVAFDWLAGAGFGRAIAMQHNEVRALGPEVRVRLFQIGHEDSALAVHHDGETVLNMNDGKPSSRTLRRMRRVIGPIDVLLTQFSPAGWPGNPDDADRLAATSQRALDQLVRQADLMRPRQVVPFASFVRFSHQENAFMNRAINRMDRVSGALGHERTTVLSPGDHWAISSPFTGSTAATDRFVAAVDAIASLPLRSHDSIPFDDVKDAAARQLEHLSGAFHRSILRRLGRITFDLNDLSRSLTLDLASGSVAENDHGMEAGRVELSSQAALYTLEHRWGVPTLLISGRFRLPAGESVFRRYKQLGSAWSNGYHTRGLGTALASQRGRAYLSHRWRELADIVPART